MIKGQSYRGLILPDAPQYERKASGFIIMDDGNGPIETAVTLQCCHCGKHWIVIKGSGRRRGWCSGCCKVHCGAPACFLCTPLEKKIEQAERGLIIL